jgi:hypothetical protein
MTDLDLLYMIIFLISKGFGQISHRNCERSPVSKNKGLSCKLGQPSFYCRYGPASGSIPTVGRRRSDHHTLLRYRRMLNDSARHHHISACRRLLAGSSERKTYVGINQEPRLLLDGEEWSQVEASSDFLAKINFERPHNFDDIQEYRGGETAPPNIHIDR